MTRQTDEQALHRELVLGWLRRQRRLRHRLHQARLWLLLTRRTR
jgi:hypothetical protein